MIAAGTGCATERTFSESYTAMKRSMNLEKPAPVSQLFCSWQRHLSTLQDPSHDGVQVRGIVGQVFMVSAETTTATAEGNLAVTAYDVTPRPAGMPEKQPSVWEFTKEVLERMRTRDERFGPCYVLFLPWPAEWTDVTQVRLLARYQGEKGPELYAPEVRVSVDFSTPGAMVVTNSSRTAGQRNGMTADSRGAVDPAKLLAGGNTTAVATRPDGFPSLTQPNGTGVPVVQSNVPVYGQPVVPTGGTMPQPINAFPPPQGAYVPGVVVPLPQGSNTRYATEGAYAGPKPPSVQPYGPGTPGSEGPIQPIIIPISR